MTAETSNARGNVVAWFPTNGRGEIIRTYGDGSPVYACRTKEEAEQAKRCHLGATGPVIPLYAAPPPTTAQQQGQAVAWADEWRAAVAAKLSSYGLSEEAAAVFASSELDEYKAGLCDCAENDPVDMVDLMMGVARDAIEKWKIESAGRPFGHKNTAPPPSAPVGGVEDVEVLKRLRAALPDVGLNGWWLGVEVLDRVIDALAAQRQEPTT